MTKNNPDHQIDGDAVDHIGDASIDAKENDSPAHPDKPAHPDNVLFRWHEQYVGNSHTKSTVYIGFGLFFLSLFFGLVSLSGFLFFTVLNPSSASHWLVREATFAIAPLGLAMLLFSVTVLVSGSRRLAGLAFAGTLVCGVALGIFSTVYPQNWDLNDQSMMTQIIGTYAVGLAILLSTTGASIRANRQQPRSRLTTEQTTIEDEHASSQESEDAPDEELIATLTDELSDDGQSSNQKSSPAKGGSGFSDEITDLHTTLVSAPSIQLESDAAQIGNQWVRTLFVAGYPDRAIIGMLDSALAIPTADFDYSVHVRPRDPSRTITTLKKSIRDLKVKQVEKSERGDVSQLDTEKALAEHEAIYSRLIDKTQQIFDVGIYVTIRAADREELDLVTDRLSTSLQAEQLTPKSASFRQDDALVCTSPIARDVLGQSAMMLGDGVGALFPFSLGTHIEDDGVLMGYHSITGSPLVVDRFAREKGYNCFVVGNTGAGKTFDTVLNLLRTLGKDDDTMVIMADPFGDLAILSDILDGERIVVSGTKGLNPLELTPTPDHVLEKNPNLDPYKQTIQKDVMGFLEAFFEMENMSLEGKRGVASVAVREAYQRRGITPDPASHGNESPTLRDVRDVLQEIAQKPLDFIEGDPETVSDIEVELWTRRASQLRMDLEPFREGGEYEHLGRHTEVKIGGSDVVYLDMQQIEGEQKTGLMLQLLLHAVYEQAKQTDKRVIFAIDEAHYLMQSKATLGFLERAIRHSRHFDLSIQLITQTVDEFFTTDKDQAKTIADNCSLKIFHQVEGLSDSNAAEWLGFSPPEAEFVRTAKPGSETDGYSQALVEVGEVGRFPVNVRALPEETALITGATERTSENTPGATSSEEPEADNLGVGVSRLRNGDTVDTGMDLGVESDTLYPDDHQDRRVDVNDVDDSVIEDDEAIIDFEDLEPDEAARLLKTFDPVKLRKESDSSRSSDLTYRTGRDGTK